MKNIKDEIPDIINLATKTILNTKIAFFTRPYYHKVHLLCVPVLAVYSSTLPELAICLLITKERVLVYIQQYSEARFILAYLKPSHINNRRHIQNPGTTVFR